MKKSSPFQQELEASAQFKIFQPSRPRKSPHRWGLTAQQRCVASPPAGFTVCCNCDVATRLSSETPLIEAPYHAAEHKSCSQRSCCRHIGRNRCWKRQPRTSTCVPTPHLQHARSACAEHSLFLAEFKEQRSCRFHGPRCCCSI